MQLLGLVIGVVFIGFVNGWSPSQLFPPNSLKRWPLKSIDLPVQQQSRLHYLHSELNAEPKKRERDQSSGFGQMKSNSSRRRVSSLGSLTIPSRSLRGQTTLTPLQPTSAQSGTGQKGGSYFSETFSFPTDNPSPSFFETKVRVLSFCVFHPSPSLSSSQRLPPHTHTPTSSLL